MEYYAIYAPSAESTGKHHQVLIECEIFSYSNKAK